MKVIRQKSPPEVSPADMEDGQIGIIRKWESTTAYIGIIVQKYEDSLIALGKHSGHSWSKVQTLTKTTHPECLIEILPPGTVLEI
jgi:hypothetical protein